MIKKKIKYLSNNELMLEIHKSKKNYSSYIDNIYSDFDMIVGSKSEITDVDVIEQAKKLRAKRLKDMAVRDLLLQQKNPKEYPELITFEPEDIKEEDLVFRIMTYEHIPYDLTRKKNPKKESEKKAKVNFPPFKHYIIENNSPKEVGRSHWIGRTW